jgi:hypothetical protein
MLLLHDIKPASVLAILIILRELKSRGIVHVEQRRCRPLL